MNTNNPQHNNAQQNETIKKLSKQNTTNKKTTRQKLKEKAIQQLSSPNQRVSKKAIQSLSNEELIDTTIQNMADALEEQINNPKSPQDQLRNNKSMNNYLYNNNNKAYHLELIKRAFKRSATFKSPDELAKLIAEYFKLCYDHDKLPTIAGLCAYTKMPDSTFRGYLNEPQSLFYPVVFQANSLIHDLTLEATLEGYVKPSLFSLLATSTWGYTPQNNSTNITINNNSKSEQEKIDHINALKLSSQDYTINTNSNTNIDD